MVKAERARGVTIITNGGGGGNNSAAAAVAADQPRPDPHHAQPRDQRTRTNEQISIDLRAQLPAARRDRPRQPAGGNFQLQRLLAAAATTRTPLALEIRGHDLDDARRVRAGRARVMEARPARRRARRPRRRRPEIRVRVDRPKAAMLGMTVGRRHDDSDQRRRHHRRAVPRARQRVPDRRAAAAGRSRGSADVGDVLLSTPAGQVVPAKNVMRRPRDRPGADRPQEHGAHHPRQRARSRSAQRSVEPCRRASPDARAARLLVGFGSEVEEQAKSFQQLQLVLILAVLLVYAVMASQYESLRDPFIIMFSVPVAASASC
jgi:HAE1 family hydrophobic/amphiphilic exporter-1